jgi:hypothetical protein
MVTTSVTGGGGGGVGEGIVVGYGVGVGVLVGVGVGYGVGVGVLVGVGVGIGVDVGGIVVGVGASVEVGVGIGVDVGGIVVGIGVSVGVGVGRGFTVIVLPIVVRVNTVVSITTSWDGADATATVVVTLEFVVFAPNCKVAIWNVPLGGVWTCAGSSPTTRSSLPVALASAMVVCLMTLPHADVVRAASDDNFTTVGSNVTSTFTNARGPSVVAHTCSAPLGGRESVAGRMDTVA